ncbi:group II intron reverse transcriptase/maturase [Photorhabdus laumondii]
MTERLVVPGKPGNAGGGKEPWFRNNAESDEELEIGQPKNSEIRSGITDDVTCESEGKIRASIPCIVRQDIPSKCVDACIPVLPPEKGAAGMDGQTFDDIESYGVERWLGELAQQLREGTYTPKPVRRVHILKPNGKTRPLGIACLRDRVCQMAAMLVLEPIFEADLPPEQHAYRRNRNAQSAVQEVHGLLTRGYNDVVDVDVDVDLSGYFDTIPHPELMKSVARRIVDGKVLRLIKQWLTAPVEEKMRDGKVQRTMANRDNQCGIPQGSPISPLLSNLYMRRFIMGWKRLGIEQRLGARIVNYADDLVICCKGRNASQAMTAMRGLMAKLKLTVNEEKTRLCGLPEGEFDFLEYTFKRLYSARTRKPYIGTRPSKKSIKRMIESIRLQMSRSLEWMDAGEMVIRLNQKLGGWTNYFRLGPVTQSYRFIDRYTTTRLRRWLCKKHKQRSRGLKRYPDEYFYNQLGLIQLPRLPQRLPWAKA